MKDVPMDDKVKISVFEVVGSPLCVSSADGQKVYQRLAAAVKAGRRVGLSFHNVSTMTSAFLNAAVGQLYSEFDEDRIRALLAVEDMASDDVALLRRVVATAKQYFQDPDRFNRALREELGGGDDGE